MLQAITPKVLLIFVAGVLDTALADAGSVSAQSSEKTAAIAITIRLPADADTE